MHKKNEMTKYKLKPLSKLTISGGEIDTIKTSKKNGSYSRAMDVLLEARRYWDNMDKFRKDRDRCKRYTYGDQWKDKIVVGGKEMTEEEYIVKQGKIPLKNNLIRRLVKNVIGVYRSQSKEPVCTARDVEEQRQSETMSTVLQCNGQLNRKDEISARTFEEFLISGICVQKKTFGWRNDKLDCWTDYVQPDNFFVDNNMRDFRGWDCTCIGEIHDVPFRELVSQFSESEEDYHKLKEIYRNASDMRLIADNAMRFGEHRLSNYSFLCPSNPTLCRVIEVWRRETKGRYRCHDYISGDIYKIDPEDKEELVDKENAKRIQQGLAAGMAKDEIPQIVCEWFIDNYWYYYYLSPFGDILKEGETPYAHHSHPYVFRIYPFIDNEVHSFVSDVIDQQRYTNRLITMYDWLVRSSAKGLLLIPKECLPDDYNLEDIADTWSSVGGVLVVKTKNGAQLPQQISTNATNIGISELLNMQLKFFEDISGVNGALQGKPGYSSTSGTLYLQQTQNATTSLLDVLDTYSSFIVDGAYKDVKNIQQFYDTKRIYNIVGKSGKVVEYDPEKIGDIEFDLSIVESTSTPAYRQIANDFLMQIWQAGQINLEQLLSVGEFPFGDELLQSVKSLEERMQASQAQQMQQAQASQQGEPTSEEQSDVAEQPQQEDAQALLDQYIQKRMNG